MRSFSSWLVIFGALYIVSSAAFARVSVSTLPGAKSVLMVLLNDEVTKDDATILMKVAEEMDRKFKGDWHILAKLNSNGGSVTAALQIGRLLRKVGSMATVEADAICMSSCVYILAGAANRAVDGTVGIHRPYESEGKEVSQSAQKAKYARLGAEIKSYLAEVNIPVKLYDDELYISPENVKILSDSELQGYGLNQNDPFTEEADAAKESKKLGITRSVLAERKAKANRRCPWNGDNSRETMLILLECRDAIVKGR